MHIISSSGEFFRRVLELEKRAEAEYLRMTSRLGVTLRQEDRVVVIVIAQNEWAAHEAITELFEACEKLYRRTIDHRRIRYVFCKDVRAAATNPNLEYARFILQVDEDLQDAESYPELEQLLPFQE